MAGIIHKIEETLHMGGNKDEKKQTEEKKHEEMKKHGDEKLGAPGEHKEGMMEKIKDKIDGEGGEHHKDGEKKKKEKKKKKKEGHEHGHDSSSSSDSD